MKTYIAKVEELEGNYQTLLDGFIEDNQIKQKQITAKDAQIKWLRGSMRLLDVFLDDKIGYFFEGQGSQCGRFTKDETEFIIKALRELEETHEG